MLRRPDNLAGKLVGNVRSRDREKVEGGADIGLSDVTMVHAEAGIMEGIRS